MDIDFSLAPNEQESIAARSNAPITLLDLAIQAVETARRCGRAFPHTWEDVARISTYALMAGYVLGVRNERKRRRK